ncbi:DUF3224 domain-containing protein [Tenggerimyces flavus]|uniref:DUF3224 domain-containing protein n=1 Tax=Tenggerimyces flavus TaxID=1708749 RepID=A0ABV7YFZ0_9ACTN|nr:DUF3224 domain-containing protein [Tenggerimyces flavus]MBM7784049.1 hypothetical protein [Tenggerimyces flavus]
MTNTFKFTSWDEAPAPEGHEGPRTVHAHTTNEFAGVIEGTSVADHVMFYSGQGEGWGSGIYYGFEQIAGSVDGRKGSFVLQHVGSFDSTTVRATWTVVEGSGTGELEGLEATGGFVSVHGEGDSTTYTFELS